MMYVVEQGGPLHEQGRPSHNQKKNRNENSARLSFSVTFRNAELSVSGLTH